MPTYYTDKIRPEGGVTFEEFVMNCARAMGACITLRDEPGGGEKIPERFEAHPYSMNELTKARERLRDLVRMTVDEVTSECSRVHSEEVGRIRLRNMERDEQRKAYEAMLSKVRSWKPPTAQHEGLRNFMVQQITESIDFDCRKQEEPVCPPPSEWHEKEVSECHRLIGYHAAEHAKEVARAADRTEWVRALRLSLKGGA